MEDLVAIFEGGEIVMLMVEIEKSVPECEQRKVGCSGKRLERVILRANKLVALIALLNKIT
ncbi:predicted protein [Sclerotinia sclerotiorum 1980 UF-70]|uniref:Uncharacterized protein n=1 Tax=Sclerotinia sclerotiorum (strain ATCC 18683 / 1980 / Ss-1) TaxID=665079 RepID=A7F4P4_SCLS1|nr:predicted protein [Sclerotinia sclerotiorum 1980 UF-70]EDN97715.1 predicted protein [Sclerotinia sclerotiorum 1980 UF-70]